MFASRGFRILSPLFLKLATNDLTDSDHRRLPVDWILLYCIALFGFSFAKQLQTYVYMTVKQYAYQDVAESVRALPISSYLPFPWHSRRYLSRSSSGTCIVSR
jgi:hypothetical protein